MNEGFLNRYTEPTINSTKQMLGELKGTVKNSLKQSPFDSATDVLISTAAWPIRAISNTTVRAVKDLFGLGVKGAIGVGKAGLDPALNAPIWPIPKKSA